MTTPLDGAWEKVKRGQRHVASLKRQHRRIVGPSQRQTIPLDPDVQDDGLTLNIVWRVGKLPDIGRPEFAVIVGDALNNFRASLDHLAWAMVKRGGIPLSKLKPREQRQIAFPLARNRRTFPGSMHRSLPGIHRGSPLGKLVESYQPYLPGKPNKALRALRDLGDRDKHRLLISAFWFPENAEFHLQAPGFSVVEREFLYGSTRHPLKSGAPVMRTRLARVSMLKSQVQLNGQGSLFPALPGSWVTFNLLDEIRDTVRKILTEASALL